MPVVAQDVTATIRRRLLPRARKSNLARTPSLGFVQKNVARRLHRRRRTQERAAAALRAHRTKRHAGRVLAQRTKRGHAREGHRKRNLPRNIVILSNKLRGCKTETRLQLLARGLSEVGGFYAGGMQEHWRCGSSELALDGLTFILRGRAESKQSPGRKAYGSGGVGIVLSPSAALAWKRAGGETFSAGERWVGVFLNKRDNCGRKLVLFLISAWAPVSGAPAADLDESYRHGNLLMDLLGSGHIPILAVDANGAIGASSVNDDPTGPFGVPPLACSLKSFDF